MTLIHYDPAPPTLFSGPFRDECEKGLSLPGSPDLYPVLELALPGTHLNLGAGLSSAERGPYAPKIVKGGWGSLTFAVDVQSQDVTTAMLEVTIDDTDRTFSVLVAKYGNTLRGGAAVCRIISPNVPDEGSFVRFSGQLDGYRQMSPFTWTLRLRPNDAPLRSDAGVAIPRNPISLADWPNAHEDAIGKYPPIIYGTHKSTGGGGSKGFLPTYYVDTVGFRYLVGMGWLKAVHAVYKDDVAVGAGFSITNVVVNGKYFTLVDFTADQTTGVITVDVDGLENVGDGTGSLITLPGGQIRHCLTNFAWNDWRGGNLFAEGSVPLDQQILLDMNVYLNDLGHEGSKWIGGDSQVKMGDLLREWLASTGLKAWWTPAGNLAIYPIDFRPGQIYQDEQVLLEEDIREFSGPDYDTESLIQESKTQYLYDHAARQFRETLIAADQTVTDPISVSRSQPWSASRKA